jgi:flagellar hook-basal body complex protein FliE
MPLELLNTSAAGASGSSLTRTAKTAAAAAGAGGSSFLDSLGNMIESVEETTADANTAVGNMVDKTGDVHEAMIALQRAEMTLQLTVQVRNKLVQAYQDIMRMPI